MIKFERRKLVEGNKANDGGKWECVDEQYVLNSIENFCGSSVEKFKILSGKLFNCITVKTRNFEYRRAD